jgi:hypothetical protein
MWNPVYFLVVKVSFFVYTLLLQGTSKATISLTPTSSSPSKTPEHAQKLKEKVSGDPCQSENPDDVDASISPQITSPTSPRTSAPVGRSVALLRLSRGQPPHGSKAAAQRDVSMTS